MGVRLPTIYLSHSQTPLKAGALCTGNFFWRSEGFLHLIPFLSCMLCLALCVPCATGNHLVSHVVGMPDCLKYDSCRSYTDDDAGLQDLLLADISSIHVQGNLLGTAGLENACTDSDYFCFLSTLPGSVAEEDDCSFSEIPEDSNDPTLTEGSALHNIGKSNSSWSADNAAFMLLNGRIISCSLNSERELHGNLHPNKNVDQNVPASCKGPSRPTSIPGKDYGSIESDLINGSSSPHVAIVPPLLNWGPNRLYIPSLAVLTVVNTCNDSILHVYEPFSTDPQFYAYNFDETSLEPGEAVSIGFVFLPRWLGSSSAHLVLQTSSGGFLVHAKGLAMESPYGVQPLVGLKVPLDGRLSENLSLYNPFDEILYIEEVTAWIAVSSENASHSAQAVCRMDTTQASNQFSSLLNVKEWLNVKSSQLGSPLIGIRPYRQWEVDPHSTETIMEINLLSHLEGKVFGAFCMKLKNSAQNWVDTIIVPLEAEVHGRVAYNTVTGSVSVFVEPLVACDDNDLIVVSLCLRNGASNLISVVKIREVTEGMKLFQVKYMEGLILFPGTLTHIALVTRIPPISSQDVPREIPNISPNCKLLIVTNESASSQIEIPCIDLLHTCSRHRTLTVLAASGTSYIGSRFQHENEKSSNARTGSLGSIVQEQSQIQSNGLKIAEADEQILRNWRSQATTTGISVLEVDEVLFPMVQVGSHYSKWITVSNPSQKPVIMQLVLNSGAIIDQCRAADESMQHPFRSLVHNNSAATGDGFSISDTAITEAYVHPYGRAFLGPIVFRPSSRCAWRSSALIRNNLSGVEWIPLRGFGGSLSMVLLEGSQPVQSLEFNLDMPSPLNVTKSEALLNTEVTRAACCQPLSKELYAKNIGDLPLEVRRIEISGTDCGLDGFMIHTCQGFSLAPGESAKLLISYQTDFSAAVVHRDLELALATGILVIPMKASLPVYMLNLCRKSFLWILVKRLSLVVLVGTFVTLMLFFRALFLSMFNGTQDYLLKGERKPIASISRVEKPSRLHRNQRNSRSFKEDENSELGYPACYSDRPIGVQEVGITAQHSKQPEDKQDQNFPFSNHRKKTLLSSSSLTAKSMTETEIPGILETPQTGGNLTVRTGKEKGRRRKRRAGGTGAVLAGKLEFSSSQSGNSTPSSPLSPLTPFAAKRTFSLSSDIEHAIEASDHNLGKERAFESSGKKGLREPEISVRCCDNSWLHSVNGQPSILKKATARPVLLPSATFPGTGWRTPGEVDTLPFSTPTSAIAPHARAPGSKLGKEKVVKTEEKEGPGEQFTYDIWGNHFSGFHLMGRPNEVTKNVPDTSSDGDSQSFFARGPQTLMQKSPKRGELS